MTYACSNSEQMTKWHLGMAKHIAKHSCLSAIQSLPLMHPVPEKLKQKLNRTYPQTPNFYQM